ncbi:MAG TPA: O-antigen ligase family protein, partial [Humisphaera sp.]
VARDAVSTEPTPAADPALRRRRRRRSGARRGHWGAPFARPETYDVATRVLLLAAVAFAPFALGAIDAWAEQIVLALTTAAAGCVALKLAVADGARFARSWAYLPAALFVGLVVLQLVPMPAAWAAAISPRAITFRQEAWAGLPAAGAWAERVTLSLYPHATARQLRVLLGGVAAFVAAVNVFRDRAAVRQALAAITVVGSAVAALQFAQLVSGTNKVYWLLPMDHPNSGPFANHSHFSQFMNLATGAAAGLLFVRLRELREAGRCRRDVLLSVRARPEARAVWGLAAAIVGMQLAMLLSLSRGGMIGAGAGAVVAASAFARSARLGWRAAAGIAGAILFAGVVAVVGSDRLAARAATLADAHEHDLRPAIARDALNLIRDFPAVGAGLGAHERVFPAYQTLLAPRVVGHADNEYLQLAEETGLAGVALVAAFLGIVLAALCRAVWRRRVPVRAAACGLAFGLTAVLTHSATDFGQHLPAVHLLTAVTCALILNLSRMRPDPTADAGSAEPATPGTASNQTELGNAPSRRRLGPAVAVCGVAAVAAWVNVGANDCRAGEAAWDAARAVDQSLRADGAGAADPAAVERMATAAEAAAARQPGNA